MASIPPPQGLNEADYDAIEAAVTETVRGRWFLNEFARRNRLAETRQLLDAMSRLEAAVASNQPSLPSADPSIRLMIQRIKEIAGALGAVAMNMREAGLDPRYVDAVDGQARAVAGMMRSGSIGRTERSTGEVETTAQPRIEPSRALPASSSPDPRQPQTPAAPQAPLIEPVPSPGHVTDDPRLAALSRLDRMSPAEKLAFFV